MPSALTCALGVLLAMQGVSLSSGFITAVPEGYVGVLYRGGAQMPGVLEPGLHFHVPMLESVEHVQVTVQTDSVADVPCGTSGGVMTHISRIEVVNMLGKDSVEETVRKYGIHYDKIWVFDKIHSEVNQFCSKHTLHQVFIERFDTLDEMLALKLQEECDKHNTGIVVMSVRVTKPIIPSAIRKTFEELEESKQRLLLKEEQKRLLESDNQYRLAREMAEAEREKAVSEMQYEKRIMEERKKAEIARIKADVEAHQRTALADSEAYAVRTRAEADAVRLTPAKLQEILYTSVAGNTKVYFGDSIPKMFADPGLSAAAGSAAAAEGKK